MEGFKTLAENCCTADGLPDKSEKPSEALCRDFVPDLQTSSVRLRRTPSPTEKEKWMIIFLAGKNADNYLNGYSPNNYFHFIIIVNDTPEKYFYTGFFIPFA